MKKLFLDDIRTINIVCTKSIVAKTIITTLFFFSSTILLANQKLTSSFFYVTAKSGLSIRETPSLKSKKIGLLKFKTKVKVLKALKNKFNTINDDGLEISSTWVLIENPNNPDQKAYVFGGFLRQKAYHNNLFIDTSNWITYINKNQKISLKQPKDWINITDNKNNDFGRDNFILITHDSSSDPTQITIREKNTSINSLLNQIKQDIIFGKIEKLIINDKSIIKYTAFFSNDCSYVQYLHKKNEVKTIVVEISGMCQSHPEGYDETKILVAESFLYLN